MKRKIYLDGELGHKFGSEIFIEAESIKDVFRCLNCNDPTFQKYLIDCQEKDIGFMCKVADKELSAEEELLLNFKEGDMYISPQPMGSGPSKSRGAFKVFAAIVIAAITGGMGAPAAAEATAAAEAAAAGSTAAGATAGVKAFFYSIAANLAISGLSEILAPDPSVDERTDNYIFQGSGQTIIEGDPVPVLYGRLRVPGRPVSFHIKSAEGTYDDFRSSHGGTNGGSGEQDPWRNAIEN